MKAIWMLDALSRCGVEANAWGFVPIGKDYQFKKFFGDEPMGEFVPGRYVWVNAAHISNDAFEYLANAADHVLFGPDPEEQCTILIRIEDET